MGPRVGVETRYLNEFFLLPVRHGDLGSIDSALGFGILTRPQLIVQLNRMERSQATAEKILDAAEKLFASKGFAATTIKMISAESGQNSALIYYYYDSKATLYGHVLQRLVEKISAEARARISQESGPEDVVKAVVESQVAVLIANPHIPVLLARELIDWKAAHAESAIRSLSSGLFERLRTAIESGQASGVFNPDINPRFAAISVVAQVGYLVLASPVAGILLGRGPDGPTADDVRAFGAHAAAFTLAALRSPTAALSGRGTSSMENVVP